MASIRDVAKLAGVSPATVSRVMNGTARVDPEKMERVQQAIEETGFVPNEVARSLFKKSAKRLLKKLTSLTLYGKLELVIYYLSPRSIEYEKRKHF